MTYQLHHGDCLNIMPLIERESVDAVICDPPYGLVEPRSLRSFGYELEHGRTEESKIARRGGFMGKSWDHGVPGMHFWLEALRCAKPGAYLLAFGGTRTFHRLAVAIEDAGWEIRDTVMWVYGQGFPKSHDVSKAIDREAGAERTEIIGRRWEANRKPGTKQAGIYGELPPDDGLLTSPATPAAAEWDGWGTALKPAWEPIIVARKPIICTVAENVQRYGTGALNIDKCRIEVDGNEPNIRDNESRGGNAHKFTGLDYNGGKEGGEIGRRATLQHPQGRWPANLIHDGSAEVLAGFPMTNGNGNGYTPANTEPTNANGRIYNLATYTNFHKSGAHHGDTGSAARFFYCAKASKQDRDEGLEGFEGCENVTRYAQRGKCVECGRWQESGETACVCGGEYERQSNQHKNNNGNHHPTVKPTALMRYLCRLVTPPNGTILDPFMGSGSTGKAAMLEGFNFIGIDTEIEYVEIAARRIEHACEKVGIVVDQPMMFETKRETVDKPKQLILL